MLNIQDLTICFGDHAPAVKQFALEMRAGEIVGIVGESGSGKTTVLRAVLGMLSGGAAVQSGDILFHGASLLTKTPEALRRLRGTKISMISQDCGSTLNPIRKIGAQYTEYIRFHSGLSKKEAVAKAQDMLAKMNLPNPENVMNSYPHQLSGGMCQRVGIAMAMTFEPELLLADEPTSALDVTTQAQIVQEMMSLRDRFGTAILLITHSLGVAAHMADRLLVMQQGVTLDAGKTADVIHHPASDYTKKLLLAVPELEGARFV